MRLVCLESGYATAAPVDLSDMQTPHLSAKFAVFNMKWVTYVIRADPQRKGQSFINYQLPQAHRCSGCGRIPTFHGKQESAVDHDAASH